MKMKKSAFLFTILAYVLGFSLAIWRIIIISNNYTDDIVSYFQSSLTSYRLFGLTAFILIALLCAYYFVIKKSVFTSTTDSNERIKTFSGCFCGFSLFISCAILLFFGDFDFTSVKQNAFYKVMIIAALFCSFVASLYFVLSSFEKFKKNRILLPLSFFPSISAILYMMASYFNGNYTYNNPDRIICNISYGMMAIAFLFIVRNNIGKHSKSVEFIFYTVASVFGMIFIIPQIFCLVSGLFVLNISMIYEISFIGLLVYTTVRQLIILNSIEE